MRVLIRHINEHEAKIRNRVWEDAPDEVRVIANHMEPLRVVLDGHVWDLRIIDYTAPEPVDLCVWGERIVKG